MTLMQATLILQNFVFAAVLHKLTGTVSRALIRKTRLESKHSRRCTTALEGFRVLHPTQSMHTRKTRGILDYALVREEVIEKKAPATS